MTERNTYDGDDFILRLPSRAELRAFIASFDADSVILGIGAGCSAMMIGFVIGIFIWG